MMLYTSDRDDALHFSGLQGYLQFPFFSFSALSKPIGLAGQSEGACVEPCQKERVEVDRPDAISDLFQGDVMADQQLAQEDRAVLEIQDPVRTDPPDLAVPGVLRLRQPLGQLARRARVQ